MPTISTFYGIIIQMYWNDHAPPHFHAIYGASKATIDIQGIFICEGSLPGRIAQLVLRWAKLHQEELMEDWELCLGKQQPKVIDPLR